MRRPSYIIYSMWFSLDTTLHTNLSLKTHPAHPTSTPEVAPLTVRAWHINTSYIYYVSTRTQAFVGRHFACSLHVGNELQTIPLWGWTWNYSLTLNTRFVGKPEGVSNVFLIYFDYLFGGVNTILGGWEAPPPPTDRALLTLHMLTYRHFHNYLAAFTSVVLIHSSGAGVISTFTWGGANFF